MDQVFGKQQEYNVDKEWNDIEHFVLQKRNGENYLEKYFNKPNQLFFDSNRIIIENIAKGLNYIYNQFEKGELNDFYILYSHHLKDLKDIHIIKS
ncbi:MAG: hypothetical protein C0596_13315 [Marinilabiliales bacterium]|nr:MAG: hypothetical protein C0596_13315 [Marinilabiliales bacterium]